MFIDTHTHIYSEQFNNDRASAISLAVEKGVTRLLLPAIDQENHSDLLDCVSKYPEICYPMIGLHPTSVKENYRIELEFVKNELNQRKYIAIGECGLDYYWDETFVSEQEKALRIQIELAISNNLPLVLHSRKSLQELFQIIQEYKNSNLTGVFHCFPGNIQEAKKAVDLGFYLGIGGVVTYKNATMADVVKEITLDNILLETDAPYLTPTPYRGKRNESAYIPLIAEFIASLKNVSLEEVAFITTNNAKKLFHIE